MLDRLLRVLSEGGAISHADLARRLEVDQGLVRSMLAHLASLGYLRPAVESCGEGCGACALEDQCSNGGANCIWTLTEKGVLATRGTG
jgi:hypothetical protein